MTTIVRTGLASAAAFGGFLLTSFIGVLVAADAVIYLVPSEGCDSGCWNNTALMRVLGVLGLAIGAGLVVSTPVAVAWLRRRLYGRALVLGVVTVLAVCAWVPWTNALLAARSGGGGLSLLP